MESVPGAIATGSILSVCSTGRLELDWGPWGQAFDSSILQRHYSAATLRTRLIENRRIEGLTPTARLRPHDCIAICRCWIGQISVQLFPAFS